VERAGTAGGTPDAVALEFARLVRSRLGERVRKIILFGSRARGEARPHSDYDVVVVVDRRTPEAREAILEIEVGLMDRHGSLVACLLRDERQWEASQRQPIGVNVAREGVPL
jgi:predicted nucleotidyltransferase